MASPNDSRSPLSQRLGALDPVDPGTLRSPSLNAALDQVGAAIVRESRGGSPKESPSPARRWRIWLGVGPRGLVAIALAAVVAAGGAAAAAKLIVSAYTGKQSTGANVQEGGPGEFLRMNAPNFCQAALAQAKGVSYPAAYAKTWKPWVLVVELNVRKVTPTGPCSSSFRAPGGRSTEVTTGAVGGYFAQSAFCAWVYDWRDASQTGQKAEAQQAKRAIDAAPSWPAVKAEAKLPGPARYKVGRQPPQTVPRMFAYMQQFINAVAADQLASVDHLITSNAGIAGCSYFVPKKGSHGGTVNPVSGNS